MVSCTLGNNQEIQTSTLLDTGATGVAFIDYEMAHHVCEILNISFIPLSKPKPIKGFDGKEAPPITHAIYPTLTVQGHTESLAPFLVTNLGQHPMILGKPWMKKHGVILDMSCDKLTFWPGHCHNVGAPKISEKKPLLIPLKIAKAQPPKQHQPTELLPHILLETRGVSKIDTPAATYVVPQKRILKPKSRQAKPALVDSEKSLNLAFIGGAPYCPTFQNQPFKVLFLA